MGGSSQAVRLVPSTLTSVVLPLTEICDCVHLDRTTTSSILTAVYGWPRISGKDKPVVDRIHAHTARIASAVVPGRYLVDILPIMKHLPTSIAKWKREGLQWHEAETKMFEEFNQGVSDRMVRVLHLGSWDLGFRCILTARCAGKGRLANLLRCVTCRDRAAPRAHQERGGLASGNHVVRLPLHTSRLRHNRAHPRPSSSAGAETVRPSSPSHPCSSDRRLALGTTPSEPCRDRNLWPTVCRCVSTLCSDMPDSRVASRPQRP